MKRSRRNHFAKFKARVELQALRGDAALASRHDVHANRIALWRKQLLEHAGERLDNGTPPLDDAERQIRDRCAKAGELTMERDFLSSALGRFVPPSATLIDRQSDVTIRSHSGKTDISNQTCHFATLRDFVPREGGVGAGEFQYRQVLARLRCGE